MVATDDDVNPVPRGRYMVDQEPFRCRECDGAWFAAGTRLTADTGNRMMEEFGSPTLWNCLGCGTLYAYNTKPKWEVLRKGRK